MFYLVCKALPLPPKFTRANKEVRKATFAETLFQVIKLKKKNTHLLLWLFSVRDCWAPSHKSERETRCPRVHSLEARSANVL